MAQGAELELISAASANGASTKSGIPVRAYRTQLLAAPLEARKAKLIEVLEDAGTKTLYYLYD